MSNSIKETIEDVKKRAEELTTQRLKHLHENKTAQEVRDLRVANAQEAEIVEPKKGK